MSRVKSLHGIDGVGGFKPYNLEKKSLARGISSWLLLEASIITNLLVPIMGYAAGLLLATS